MGSHISTIRVAMTQGKRGKTKEYDEYSLQALDNNWHSFAETFLDRTETDHSTRFLTIEDEIDSRGVFQKQEFKTELKKLYRVDLEGQLGISKQKITTILDAAEKKTQQRPKSYTETTKKGEIQYRDFLEVVQEYRLNTEQESKLQTALRPIAFAEEFTCSPPTFIMIGITAIELAMFVYTSVYLTYVKDNNITWTGPVPFCSHLIYNPTRRWEVWRLFTYMFVHVGIGHFVFNMMMQILVGVFLEMEQSGVLGSFKVLVVYLAGVLAGSLGTSLSDPRTYIAGASGGVYALIAAHLATMVLNWQEDNSIKIRKVVKKPLTKIIRIGFISVLTLHDIGYAVYVRLYDPKNRTGFMGHLCGALSGLTVGLFLLDNRRVKKWEPYVQWFALLCYIGFITLAVVWNIFGNEWFPDYYPPSDDMLYKEGTCQDYGFM